MIEVKNRNEARKQNWLGLGLDVVWYLFMFIALQLAGMLLAGIVAMFAKGMDFSNMWQSLTQLQWNNDVKQVIVGNALGSLLIIFVFARFKWAPITRTYIKTKPWLAMLWILFLAIGTVVPSMGIQEIFNLDMPEEMMQMMTDMMKSPAGYIAVGILAPIAEEMVFRGSILRKLLALMGDKWHWIAILISAIIFGVAHGNSAQFVHALLMGMLLGWLYFRTKSVIPGIALHWVNNTIAYVMVNILPPGMEDITLRQLAGGSTTHMILYIVFSLCIFCPALFQLNRLLNSDSSKNSK